MIYKLRLAVTGRTRKELVKHAHQLLDEEITRMTWVDNCGGLFYDGNIPVDMDWDIAQFTEGTVLSLVSDDSICECPPLE